MMKLSDLNFTSVMEAKPVESAHTCRVISACPVNPVVSHPYIQGQKWARKHKNMVIAIGLPCGQVVRNITAYESELDYDVLIGMDIILLGDFAFTNKDGQSVFSFRIPSKEHIELTE